MSMETVAIVGICVLLLMYLSFALLLPERF